LYNLFIVFITHARTLSFLFFTPYFKKINCINNLLDAHIYKLSFANSAMTSAHEVSAVKKRQQYFDICDYRYTCLC